MLKNEENMKLDVISEDEEPLISVIIPVYNVEQYVDKCIRSVCAQSYSKLEIIIVDDGSTDSSLQKCKEWETKDARVRVLHKNNGGLSSARNAGLDVAIGKYIGFVDSDDYILPNMYERLLELLSKNKADVARCDFFRTDEIVEKNIAKVEVFNSEEAFLYAVSNAKWSVWCNLYVSKIWEKVRFPYGLYYEDALSFPEIAVQTKKWVITTEKLYVYNTSNASITRCDMTQKHWKDAAEMTRVIGKYANSFENHAESAAYHVWRQWVNYFSMVLNSNLITKNSIKEEWKANQTELAPLIEKMLCSKEYKLSSAKTKIRFWGFAHWPIISQKILNKWSGIY